MNFAAETRRVTSADTQAAIRTEVGPEGEAYTRTSAEARDQKAQVVVHFELCGVL
jgi:hypothetical protein